MRTCLTTDNTVSYFLFSSLFSPLSSPLLSAGTHLHEMANNNEDYMRFDHAQHHDKSYGHHNDESNEKDQFHASNLSGEENRFYQERAAAQHHLAVGIDETTASKEIWDAMRSKGYEKVEARTSAPAVVRIDQQDQTLEHDVKAITAKDRIHLKNSPRSDHWKYDGLKDQVFVPKPPPRRTDASRGVARFI